MEWFALGMLLVLAVQGINRLEQSGRVALLGQHLGRYHVENLMAQLTEGYLRALDTPDPERREQLWAALDAMAQELNRQFSAFVKSFADVYGGQTQMSLLPFALPRAAQLFPQAAVDVRKLLAVHANGIADVVANNALRSRRDKAYMLTAELYLMQHTCHWFGKTRTIASIRLVTRHKTQYEQVLASVAPSTRRAYLKLIGDSN